MFKTAFACAALALVSAQNLQELANEANAALGPILNQTNPIVQNGDTLTLNINNYEWILTEQGNEFEFSINELASNANNLAPSLAALLANVGSVIQSNPEVAAGLLETEAANLGISIDDNGSLTQAASQYGAQLSNNANNLAAALNNNYQQTASDLTSNANGVTSQINQQINSAVNNQESLSSAVSSAANNAANNAIASALQNADALNNINTGSLPVQVNDNLGSVVNAASNTNVANSLNNAVNDQASQLNGLANQAVNAGSNAANGAVGNLASSVGSTASNAVNSVSNAVNNVANSILGNL